MKALVTAYVDKEELKRLEGRCEIVYEPWRETNNMYFEAKVLLEKLKGFDIFITEADELKEEVILQSDLKILAACRNDPFQINVAAANKKNLPVIFTPNRNADAVADLASMMILSLVRRFTEVDRFMHSDKFEVYDLDGWIKLMNDFLGHELNGVKVGIVGLGGIGKKVATRLSAFGTSLLIHDPFLSADVIKQYGEACDLKSLMEKSDVVTIHAAPTEQTRHMINADLIACMKPTAYLVNTAKASIVDTSALYKAIEGKKIAGAALDVFDIEPLDQDNEFMKFPNVICMAHLGSNTHEVIKRQTKMVVDDIIAILDKKDPKYVLNPEVLGIQKKPDYLNTLGKEIIETGLTLLREGFVTGKAGNISVRVPKEDKMIITPSQLEYDKIRIEDLVVLDFKGNVIYGNKNPSVEKSMHLSVYKARSDVSAVIHSHGIYSTVLSLHKQELPPIIEEFVPFIGGPVAVAEYGAAGSEELAKAAVEALGEKSAVMIANHGNLCAGSHLKGCLTILRMLERTAQIYVLSRILGPNPINLPDDTLDYEKDIFEIYKEDKKI